MKMLVQTVYEEHHYTHASVITDKSPSPTLPHCLPYMSRGGAVGVSGLCTESGGLCTESGGLCTESGGGESIVSSPAMFFRHFGQVLLLCKDKIIKIM